VKTYEPNDIRNVLLVGHGGAGKTALLEAMLFTSGSLTRMGRVEDGNTVSDFEPEEVKKQISVSLAMAPVEWNGVKINVLDAPGYADFVGDVRSAIRAVDAVILVVSAVDGVHRISYEERGGVRTLTARRVIDCTGRAGLMSRKGSGRVAVDAPLRAESPPSPFTLTDGGVP